MGAFKTLAFFLRSYRKLESSIGQNRQMGGKEYMHPHWSITSWLREHFKLGSIAAAQSLTVDPSFSDYIWSFKAMTTDKRVLIFIFEMSAKEIEKYIKCFDVNVQTWVIIVRADQVQGALKSHLQRHGSCLHRLD